MADVPDLTTFDYSELSPRRFFASENLWRLMQLENSAALLSTSEQQWVAGIRARFDSPRGRSITQSEWDRIADLWLEALARSTGMLVVETMAPSLRFFTPSVS